MLLRKIRRKKKKGYIYLCIFMEATSRPLAPCVNDTTGGRDFFSPVYL